jgi:O-antigen ligase
VGLLAFAVAGGISLAVGELQAMWVTISVALAFAVLADFRIGAVALILMLPIQNIVWFPHALLGITGVNPANLVLGATLVSYVLRGRQQLVGRLAPPALVWLYMAPIVVAGLLGIPHVPDIVPTFYEREVLHFTEWPGYLRDMLVRPLLFVVIALLVGAAAAQSQKPERFLVPIAVSVWLMALTVIGYVLYEGVPIGRLAATSQREFLSPLGVHANGVGRLFACAYALLLFPWWDSKKPGLKLFLFLTMGVLTFALLLTFSRGAFTGFIVINLIFFAWKFNLRLLALGLVGLAVVSLFMPGYVIDRVTVGFDTGEANDMTAGRVDGIWVPLAHEIAKSPLWGNGLGSVTWLPPMQAGEMLEVTHPHNAFIEAILDMGIIGLGLMLAYFWTVWRGFRALGSNPWLSPEMRGLFQGAAAALVCFLVTGMAGSSLRPDPDFLYLWLAIGLMYGMMARKPAS